MGTASNEIKISRTFWLCNTTKFLTRQKKLTEYSLLRYFLTSFFGAQGIKNEVQIDTK
jgi:hypothetical protein